MARKRRGRCNSYIPEEIIFYILSWLSVKSLIRFKSVCKLWLSVISNDRFIQTHLANSYKNKPLLLYYKNYIYYKNYSHLEVHETHEDSVKLYQLPLHHAHVINISSCNGVVCLSNKDSDVICLWNPITKRFKLLPTPDKKKSKGVVFLGFGFDPISNDYKLLRIMFTSLCPPHQPYAPPEVELYSANNDSWKEIKICETLVLQRYSPHRESKFVHAKTGVLYLENHRELLAFDLHNEVFTLYPSPKLGFYLRSNVLDYEGSVAVVFATRDKRVLSLYVLDDACAKGSWSEIFAVEFDSTMTRILHYLGDGQFVAHHFPDEHYVIYDCKNRDIKQTPLDKCGHAVKYTESLVSLHGFKEQA